MKKNKRLLLAIVFGMITMCNITAFATNNVSEDVYSNIYDTSEITKEPLLKEKENDFITLEYADKIIEQDGGTHFDETNYKHVELKKADYQKVYKLYLKLLDKFNEKAAKENLKLEYIRPGNSNEFQKINFGTGININNPHYRLDSSFRIEINTKKCWYLITVMGHGPNIYGHYEFYTLTDEELNLLKEILPYEKVTQNNVIKQENKNNISNTQNVLNNKSENENENKELVSNNNDYKEIEVEAEAEDSDDTRIENKEEQSGYWEEFKKLPFIEIILFMALFIGLIIFIGTNENARKAFDKMHGHNYDKYD